MRLDRATLGRVFEGAPRFVERVAQVEAGSWDEFFDRAEQIALAMPFEEQVELLGAHPRIGAAAASVSAMSYREQGYDRGAGSADLQARLDRLNDEYESRHGFRFVIFVNGRSREAIAELMPRHIEQPTDAERKRALKDVVAIARSRARSGGVPELAPAIAEYYERGGELTRLSASAGLLEFLRTQQIVRRDLPPPSMKVLDVGGGAGAHAKWLAADGHDVRLIDPVRFHVDRAREAAAQSEAPFTAELGDARQLPVADASVDAILLLGPLYHLTEREERVTALSEARRVLRPGGICFAAAISRFGSWLYGLQAELLGDDEYREMAATDASTGQHRAVKGQWFTTAYFHRPDELADECAAAGLNVDDVVAVEGVGPMLADLDARLADPARREQLLNGLAFTEREPSMLGATSHIIAISRRPSQEVS